MRPGIQSLIQASINGEFDIVLTEAMDRLSRDQEDIAGIYKRMEFAGIKIITLSEGHINTMHIGLKGTMNALFLKDLADKTRRGQRGRVESGKSGGGLSYGYMLQHHVDANGQLIRGDRAINEEQAEVVRKIYTDYVVANKSAKTIASELNDEGIPSPSGKGWTQSSINGNRRRGLGILNNHLYIGQMVWNRQRFIKDPTTGKRVSRLNDEKDWVLKDMPELRIVPQELWDAVRAKQRVLDTKNNNMGKYRRPQYLLSGLLKCGSCGGSYSKINASRYGCAAARNKGASYCTNIRTVKREILENAVLRAFQSQMMRDEALEKFCTSWIEQKKIARLNEQKEKKHLNAQLRKLGQEKAKLIQAIKDGVPGSVVADDLKEVHAKIEQAEQLLSNHKPDSDPIPHPTSNRSFPDVLAIQ